MINNSLYGGELLPSQLSDEATKMYFKKYNQGSRESYDILVVHNLRLVIYIASQFPNTGYELEELVSIGNIGLIKAVHTFDLSKKFKFATYATRCITNEILMFLRRKKEYISLEEPAYSDDEGSGLKLIDILADESFSVTERYELVETIDELSKAMKILDNREQRIIYLLYICEKHRFTQREVANTMNLSQSYISRIRKRACHKMASYINGKYSKAVVNSDNDDVYRKRLK